MQKSKEIANTISALPTTPGVYQYFDKDDVVIYVGKAKSLKSRVSSYFNSNAQHNAKTRILVKENSKNKNDKSAYRNGCAFIGKHFNKKTTAEIQYSIKR